MKRIILIFSFFVSIPFWAQIPQGYYQDTNDLQGYQLKTALYNIIKDHNDQGYNMIDGFFVAHDLDVYYENDGTILDPYSENPNGADPYNFIPTVNACGNYSGEGNCYNKEHIIPQSIFSSNNPMRGDAHHLLPTDGRVNGFRSNFPFGIVGNNLISQSGISNPTQNGSKAGNNINTGVAAGYTGTVFEPIDEFKGDIARIYFYFVTRYENLVGNWSSYPMFDGSANQVLSTPFLNMMFAWHTQDPVSQKEIDRNNAIYQYQGNRNPFVDFPEWVCKVWNINNCILNNSHFDYEMGLKIYPNPTLNNEITIKSNHSLESILIYDSKGQLMRNYEPKENQFNIFDLPNGFWIIKVTTLYGSETRNVIVK